MTHSTTLLSKISKTKKRLSEEQWQAGCGILGLSLVLIIMMAGFRAVTMPAAFSSIHGEIPVLAAPPVDSSWHNYQEKTTATLRRSTPTVVLTTDAFYFGDMRSFTEDFHDVRSKYKIRHVEGEPQLQTLIVQLEKWLGERNNKEAPMDAGIVVFVPSGEIPTPIVIQVMAGLQSRNSFKRVVLGGGIF